MQNRSWRGMSGLTHTLRTSLSTIRKAKVRGVPVEEVVGWCQSRAHARAHAEEERRDCAQGKWTRREFLGATAAATAGMALAQPHASFATTAGSQRIAVIGAGLAGLRFAHYQWTVNHIKTTVYEANPDRIGGRVWTNRNFFAGGQIAEHGAEFINTEHKSMRKLAAMFGLKLNVVNGGSELCCPDVSWLDGSYYTMKQLTADLAVVQPALDAAYRSAPFPQTYNNYTAAAYSLDHTAASDWISRNVPGGTSSKLGRILQTTLLSEYGCEPATQSALNLIYLLGGGSGGGLAGGDEKYHVAVGNDSIPTMLANQLPAATIQKGYTMVALALNSDGTYTCTFQTAGGTKTAIADHVVMALPFSRIKLVDVSQAGFSATKLLAIQNYVLGTNAKLALQFNSRPWTNDGYSGVCYADPNSFQLSWDATVSQPGPRGILQRFPGGNAGGVNAFPGAAPHGIAPAYVVSSFLSGIEAPFPGCTSAYSGLATLDWWATDPYIGGAYGCYQIGDITSFSGIESVKEGNVHFCGEETDLNFQGFMEGAVRSAENLAMHWPHL